MANSSLPQDVAAKIDQLSINTIGVVLKKLPDEIFHYTSANGLLGILSETQLRATNISFLNDSTEYQHSIDGFSFVARHNLKPDNPIPSNILLNNILERISRASGEKLIPPVYVSCFSEVSDSLSQWRGYGHGEGGFAIGFNVPKLIDVVLTEGALLWPCIYAPQEQARLYEKLLLELDKIFQQAVFANSDLQNSSSFASEFAKYALLKLSVFAPLIKHHAFKEESEWRIVRTLEAWDVRNLKFIVRGTTISGFQPISMTSKVGSSGLMPISSIIVGPSRHMGLSKVALEAFLMQLGYPNGLVRLSTVPFRSI
ncbi:MAG: DUF2971 domain-containing protein [Alphaproteobacteria bacterium]